MDIICGAIKTNITLRCSYKYLGALHLILQNIVFNVFGDSDKRHRREIIVKYSEE